MLVQPVTEENAKSTEVYFPGDKTESWIDIMSLESHRGGSKVTVETPMHKIPIFQRAGAIIPRRFRIRRSAILGIEDPITLAIAANENVWTVTPTVAGKIDVFAQQGVAKGRLYLDDGVSRDHLDGEYVHMEFQLGNNILRSKLLHSASKYKTKVWLERVFISGWKFRPSSIEISELPSGQKSVLEFFYDEKHGILTVRKPGVNLSKEWAIVVRP